MKAIYASEIMTTPVISAREDASARDVALELLSGVFSGMPVTDYENNIIGIISELDIIKAVKNENDLKNTLVSEIMTPDPVTAVEDATAEEFIRIMEEFYIIRLPVVRDGKLVGIVSRSDVLRAIVDPKIVSHR
ncbi:MAG: CBS domain-containing protein [Nitrospinales bacterium]